MQTYCGYLNSRCCIMFRDESTTFQATQKSYDTRTTHRADGPKRSLSNCKGETQHVPDLPVALSPRITIFTTNNPNTRAIFVQASSLAESKIQHVLLNTLPIPAFWSLRCTFGSMRRMPLACNAAADTGPPGMPPSRRDPSCPMARSVHKQRCKPATA